MKLGEMLMRDGRLTQEQLDQLLARQRNDVGRLGTLMVEAGLIDIETLTVYLGLESGIPIASGPTLERCKGSAVRQLTPEQAARLRCVPIIVQGQTLIVAMDNPHDLWAIEEIAQATGYRVIPRIAPESRIYYYLERFYGVPRPPRFAAMGDAARGSQHITEEMKSLPAPPLPGLPPEHESPVAAPGPAPGLRSARRQPPPPVPETRPPTTPPLPEEATYEYEAIEIEAADLLTELDADESEVAVTAPRTDASERRRGPPTPAPSYAMLSLPAAVDALRAASDRAGISRALLGYCAGVFEVATLFMVKEKLAFGWKGFGPSLNQNRLKAMLIPLDRPSMFQTALSELNFFQGEVFPATLHNYLFKVLDCSPPSHAAVVVVAIGPRVVNVIYGHRAVGDLWSDDLTEALHSLSKETTAAYVRMISASKASRAVPASEDSDNEAAGGTPIVLATEHDSDSDSDSDSDGVAAEAPNEVRADASEAESGDPSDGTGSDSGGSGRPASTSSSEAENPPAPAGA